MPFCDLQLDEARTRVTCKICGEPFPVTVEELHTFNFDLTKFDKMCLVQSDAAQVVHAKLKKPPLLYRVRNFLRAWFVHIWFSAPRVSARKARKRLTVCKSCPLNLYHDGFCVHDSCGCPIHDRDTYFSKLYWRDGKCPAGFW